MQKSYWKQTGRYPELSNVSSAVSQVTTEDENYTKHILLRMFAGGWCMSPDKILLEAELLQRKYSLVDM